MDIYVKVTVLCLLVVAAAIAQGVDSQEAVYEGETADFQEESVDEKFRSPDGSSALDGNPEGESSPIADVASQDGIPQNAESSEDRAPVAVAAPDFIPAAAPAPIISASAYSNTSASVVPAKEQATKPTTTVLSASSYGISSATVTLGQVQQPQPTQQSQPAQQSQPQSQQAKQTQPGGPAPNSAKNKMSPMPYSFQYAVNDDEIDLAFGHRESSDGSAVTGTYYVLLPDGRWQTVNYKADSNGYVAEVLYETEGKAEEIPVPSKATSGKLQDATNGTATTAPNTPQVTTTTGRPFSTLIPVVIPASSTSAPVKVTQSSVPVSTSQSLPTIAPAVPSTTKSPSTAASGTVPVSSSTTTNSATPQSTPSAAVGPQSTSSAAAPAVSTPQPNLNNAQVYLTVPAPIPQSAPALVSISQPPLTVSASAYAIPQQVPTAPAAQSSVQNPQNVSASVTAAAPATPAVPVTTTAPTTTTVSAASSAPTTKATTTIPTTTVPVWPTVKTPVVPSAPIVDATPAIAPSGPVVIPPSPGNARAPVPNSQPIPANYNRSPVEAQTVGYGYGQSPSSWSQADAPVPAYPSLPIPLQRSTARPTQW